MKTTYPTGCMTFTHEGVEVTHYSDNNPGFYTDQPITEKQHKAILKTLAARSDNIDTSLDRAMGTKLH